MGKLFGTDGIRGVVNETLDSPLAYRTGLATAISLGRSCGRTPLVVIGKDTRVSSDMLECAIIAGLCAGGANVIQLGVISTPAVAYLAVFNSADAGIVISASHNPYEHNGIKMFSSDGFKLSDELEDGIEALILSEGDLPVQTGAGIGQVFYGRHCSDYYIRHLLSTVKEEITDLRVLVDCANGAASKTAPRIFSRFNADVAYINEQPNGVNVNNGCGSTHLAMLSQRVVSGCYDVGIAFDGDADRCLVVDEKGRVVDGDQIMAICASWMKKHGKLKNNGFVATVMSNLGLHKYAEKEGLTLLCAQVGDRNVRELMQEKGMVLGGEQSGHIIFLEDMPTGDGQLTALRFLQILSQSGTTVSGLAAAVTQYPQVLLNVSSPVTREGKDAVLASPEVTAAVAAGEAELAGDGRVFVRASGTEALIRVMVEAGTQETAKRIGEHIAKSVEIAQNKI